MTEISMSVIDAQSEALNNLSDALKKLVDEFMATAQYSTITELRELLLEFLEPLLSEASDIAAAYAASAYDAIREESAGAALGATAHSGRDPKATEGAVRAFLQKIVEGKPDAFINLLKERVDYEIKRAAAESTFYNSGKDPLAPRFARVPTGRETCPFCIMLASRGFVYNSYEEAGGLNHFHANCDCRIVPGFKGMKVEGYNPNELLEQFYDDLKSGKLKLKDVKKSTKETIKWHSNQFKNVGDFINFIKESTTIEDLQQRCAIVEQEFKNTGLSEKYFQSIRIAVQEIRDHLIRSVA